MKKNLTAGTEFFAQDVMDALVQMEAESESLKNPNKACAHWTLNAMFEAFEMACWGALYDCLGPVHPYYLKKEFTVQDLMDADGPWLILMTLLGHGVGIWDGSWDEFFTNPKEDIKLVQQHLKTKLSFFADDTGGGVIPEQLRIQACLSLGLDPHAVADPLGL
jgi:hypothetical protein